MDIRTADQQFLASPYWNPRPLVRVPVEWDNPLVWLVLEDCADEWGVGDETVLDIHDRHGRLTHYVWLLPPDAWAEARRRILAARPRPQS